jgi:hypothetical protein
MNQQSRALADGRVVTQYRSTLHCLTQTLATEGVFGLYKVGLIERSYVCSHVVACPCPLVSRSHAVRAA